MKEQEAGGGSQRIHSEEAPGWCSVSSSPFPSTSHILLYPPQSHLPGNTLTGTAKVCVLGGATAIKVDSSDEPSQG